MKANEKLISKKPLESFEARLSKNIKKILNIKIN
jgi:hypothetical protein